MKEALVVLMQTLFVTDAAWQGMMPLGWRDHHIFLKSHLPMHCNVLIHYLITTVLTGLVYYIG